MQPTRIPWLIPMAGLLGLSGVILGAFGAHALREMLSARMLEGFVTATRYQILHAVALLALGGLPEVSIRHRRWVGRLWGLGVLLFAGSIYLIAATGWRWLGPVTPMGGALLIAGWAWLFLASLTPKRTVL